MVLLRNQHSCRKIFSRITHSTHQNDYKEFPSSWFKGLDKENTILRENYEPSCNKYKVKAGQVSI